MRLIPGTVVTRRDAEHLQVGLDPPRRAVLADTEHVRVLLSLLRTGLSGPRAAAATLPERVLLERLDRAGLLVDADQPTPQITAARAQCRIAIDGPADLTRAAHRLVMASGLGLAQTDSAADVVLVLALGEPRRDRLDPWMRRSTAHLLVSLHVDRCRVGPFVTPGLTACLRCVDARLADRDPRRPLILEQVCGHPLTQVRPEPALEQLALSLAVHELATYAAGDSPATWSTSIMLEAGATPEATSWERHPHCGCCWGDLLTDARRSVS